MRSDLMSLEVTSLKILSEVVDASEVVSIDKESCEKSRCQILASKEATKP